MGIGIHVITGKALVAEVSRIITVAVTITCLTFVIAITLEIVKISIIKAVGTAYRTRTGGPATALACFTIIHIIEECIRITLCTNRRISAGGTKRNMWTNKLSNCDEGGKQYDGFNQH